MATPADEVKAHTFRKYTDGDHEITRWSEQIFDGDRTHKCPTYVHQTPPCQGSCPSGEDIRGWLNIVRGIEKPADGMDWQEYAFRRSTQANPFPSVMGRVCPAPCQDGCNRNQVEDFVGINAVEQFIGDSALDAGLTFTAGADTGKKVAIIGGGPCGLSAAYQLRLKGHACTIFDDHDVNSMVAICDICKAQFNKALPAYQFPMDMITSLHQVVGDAIQLGTKE